jgi:hypothetical protein
MLMRTRLRTLLLVTSSALLASACFAEAWSSLVTGKAEWGLRRNLVLLSVSREQSEVGFLFLVGFWVLLGLVLAWLALRFIRVFAGYGSERDEALALESLAQTQGAAPSGLKPLWIGLLIFFACFLAYVAAA